MGLFWLSLWISLAPASRLLLERTAAQVNDQIIYLSDVHHFRKTVELRGQLDPLFRQSKIGSLLSERKDVSDDAILEALIDERLVLDQFPVTPAEVDQQIQQIQAANRTDRSGLEAALSEQGHSFADYREIWRVSLAKKALHSTELQTRIVITKDDLRQEFYKLESQQGRALEYHLRWIRIPQATYRTADLAKQAAEAVFDRIKKGEKFETVAAASSEDPSKEQGGDLGFFPLGDLSENVRDQIKKLKIGEMSPLFQDAGIWTIVRVDDIRSGADDQFAKIEDQLRSTLTQRELGHQTELWQERQRSKAVIHKSGGI